METGTQNLTRWILGGLAAGGVVIGIAIAAYAIGYNRGQDHRSAVPGTVPATTTAPTTSTPTTTPPATTAAATVAVTPALVGRGKQLFTADSCSGCHSITGAAGAGPSLKGVAGSTVTLDNGQTVTADDAYLEESITSPDARIVGGYHSGLMGPAISSLDLGAKAQDVQALVAYIKSLK